MKKFTLIFLLLSSAPITYAQNQFSLSELFGKWVLVNVKEGDSLTHQKEKLLYKISYRDIEAENNLKKNIDSKAVNANFIKTIQPNYYFEFKENKKCLFAAGGEKESGTYYIREGTGNGSIWHQLVLKLENSGEGEAKYPMVFDKMGNEFYITLTFIEEEEITGTFVTQTENTLLYRKVKAP